MAQNKQSKKLLSAFIVLGLVSIILLNILSFSFKSVRASPAGTTINVVPSQTTVGTADAIIPNSTEGGLPFTINVTVTDVTDLYAWQVRIYFFPSIISVNMTMYPPVIPADSIFQGKQTVGEVPPTFEDLTQILENETAVNLANPLNPPTEWRWTNSPKGVRKESMTDWLDIDGTGTLSVSDIVWMKQQTDLNALYFRVARVEIAGSTITLTAELAYMLWAASLLGTEVPVSGSGTLCQLPFMGLGQGSSVLNFSRPLGGDTSLLDADVNAISFDVIDGSVIVQGIPQGRETSTITLNVDKTSLKLGDNVTITGNINPVRPNVDVKIAYKTSGSYTPLATVKTDIHSAYSYTWIPPNRGTFTINASWAGDTTTEGAVSGETIISVGEGGGTDFLGTYLPYIAVGIIVIVVVVVLLYWFKIRKK